MVRAAGKFRMISWDMRGHAKSDSPDDAAMYSKQHQVLPACAFAAIVPRRGPPHAAVARGSSVVGDVAAAFATTRVTIARACPRCRWTT